MRSLHKPGKIMISASKRRHYTTKVVLGRTRRISRSIPIDSIDESDDPFEAPVRCTAALRSDLQNGHMLIPAEHSRWYHPPVGDVKQE